MPSARSGDGNEVWLVTGGGALSPVSNVYATVSPVFLSRADFIAGDR